MKKNITLVILAAGMGSRFGGLKQITPMGPHDEFIIDYSVYDAIKAGFTKIVFLIKKENYQEFKETIGKRVETKIKVEYAFQDNSNVPNGYNVPKSRVKPLGTAHAILCCKDKVKEDFAIINADDFYGRDAYMVASKFLQEDSNTKLERYGLVGYLVKNTITDNGAVKRGVCKVQDNKLCALKESSVSKEDGKIIARPLDGNKPFIVRDDDVVSMNMLLFRPSIFQYIEEKFPLFLATNKDSLDVAEFLIPDVLFQSIKEHFAEVDILTTKATWYGVTYKEDTPTVKAALRRLTDAKIYPQNLWK